jgi:hypothetical protein
MGEVEVNVPAKAGNSERWGEWAILRQPPQGTVVLNLSAVRFADPLFLLRLRGFIEWHCHNGHAVRVVRPQSGALRNYLARMQLDQDLPASCKCDLGRVRPRKLDDVLIPIRRLTPQRDSDELDDELAALLYAQFTEDLGGFGDAFTRTVSEMCDNATTHGSSDVGHAYITAQRYRQGRCVLAIGDLGMGSPSTFVRRSPSSRTTARRFAKPARRGLPPPAVPTAASATSS